MIKHQQKQDPSTSPTAFENGYYFDLEVTPSNDCRNFIFKKNKRKTKTTSLKEK
jgi:hypothetical protein